MDALRQTVAGGGCSADGAAAAQNPVGALVNGLLDAPQAPDHKQFSAAGGAQAAIPAHVAHGAATGRVPEAAQLGSHAAAAAHAAAVAEANTAVQHHGAAMGQQSAPVHPGPAVTAHDPAAAHAHAARAHDLERAHREAALGAAWQQASAHGRPAAPPPPTAYAHSMPQLQHQMHPMPYRQMHHGMQYPMQYQMPQPMQHSFSSQAPYNFQPQQQQQAPAVTAALGAASASATDASAGNATASGAAPAQGDAAMRSAAARLREAMESSDDPRFQDSSLLEAMRTLSGGESAPEQAGAAERGESARGEHPALAAARALRAEQEAGGGGAAESPAEMEARMAEAGYSGGDGGVDFEALWRDLMSEESTEALEQMWREGYEQRLAEGMDAAVDAAGPAGAAEEGVERIPYALGPREENPFLSGAAQARTQAAPGAEVEAVAGESELFARAVALLRAGRATEAAQAFEAELHERGDNAEAWRLLGKCHAELDADRSAIACLQRAVEHDPYNLDALLALGVSHVNEMQHRAALETLRAWVEHNPRFQGLRVEEDPHSDGSLLDGVTQLMLRAAAWAPKDAQVQEVLGVLYNVSHDYASAAAAFNRALAASGADPALWNKLGATHANGNRSEEAVPAYRRCVACSTAPLRRPAPALPSHTPTLRPAPAAAPSSSSRATPARGSTSAFPSTTWAATRRRFPRTAPPSPSAPAPCTCGATCACPSAQWAASTSSTEPTSAIWRRSARNSISRSCPDHAPRFRPPVGRSPQ